MKMINQDTICAIATAQGGAIGIIRVSGPKAIEITSRIFTPATGKPLTERAPYTLTFGKICSPKRKINNTLFQKTSEIPQEKSETLQKKESIIPSAEEVIDEVLISLFRAPHSYTGTIPRFRYSKYSLRLHKPVSNANGRWGKNGMDGLMCVVCMSSRNSTV